MNRLIQSDLENIIAKAHPDFQALREAKIFVTGGTGFLGSWIVGSLLRANDQLDLGMELTLLTRKRPSALKGIKKWESRTSVNLIEGDIRRFEFPQGTFTHILHLAAPVLSGVDTSEMYPTLVEGAARIAQMAKASNVRRMLFLSSGAIYGPSTDGQEQGFSESDSNSAILITPYSKGKRDAEKLLLDQAQKPGSFELVIARGFSFIGPLCPLDAVFAATNFIRDSLKGGPIRISGNGRPIRSYLYASDCVVWILKMLAHSHNPSQTEPIYNLGSDEPVSIRSLAERIADEFTPKPEVIVEGGTSSGRGSDYYLPNLSKVKRELGLSTEVSLNEAVRRTVAWYQSIN